MSVQYAVQEIRSSDGSRLRRFTFPLDRVGVDYRSRTSVNAFAYGNKGRNVNDRGGVWYLMRRDDDIDPADNPSDVIALQSVWEFYAAVGYDHRKNCYADVR